MTKCLWCRKPMNVSEGESYPVCCSDDCNYDYLNHETEQRRIDNETPTHSYRKIKRSSMKLMEALTGNKYKMHNKFGLISYNQLKI